MTVMLILMVEELLTLGHTLNMLEVILLQPVTGVAGGRVIIKTAVKPNTSLDNPTTGDITIHGNIKFTTGGQPQVERQVKLLETLH